MASSLPCVSKKNNVEENMRVSAYTDDLEVVETQLSPKQILANGIDPWRVDLFDDNPVKIKIDGEQLNFRRLDDVAFTYRRGDRVFMGLHQPSGPMCFRGNQGPSISGATNLAAPKPCSSSFDAHFLEYLTALDRGTYGRYGEVSFDKPMPASSLRLQANWLRLEPRDAIKICDTQFTGQMFQEVPFTATLADEVNWVFEALEPWQPIVIGVALRRSFHGIPVKEVYFMLDSLSLAAPFNHLRRKYAVKVPGYFSNYVPGPCRLSDRGTVLTTFEHEGCTYKVQPKAKDPLTFRFRQENHFSADSLYSTRPGQLIGSRIALHDLGLRQARKMARHWEMEEWSLERQAELKEDGFEILAARDATTKTGILQAVAHGLRLAGSNRRMESDKETWDW
jgi:hypothetical protein